MCVCVCGHLYLDVCMHASVYINGNIMGKWCKLLYYIVENIVCEVSSAIREFACINFNTTFKKF